MDFQPNDINITLQCANCARYNKDGLLGEEWWEEGEKDQFYKKADCLVS